MRTRKHVVATLDFLERQVARQYAETGFQNIVEADGKAVSWSEALASIAEMRAKGYRYYPACEAIAPDGGCAGHPLEEV